MINILSGSGALNGAESGCRKNRLECWAANRPLTLRWHSLHIAKAVSAEQSVLKLSTSPDMCTHFHVMLQETKLWQNSVISSKFQQNCRF